MNHSNPEQQRNKFGIPPVQPPTARQALKFLFLPDLKGSVSPLKDAGQMFVKLVALVFAQQGLFPRNHPALTTDARIDFAEVFRTAYQNLRWTKAGTPQLLFFFAVVGMLACSIIAVLSLILGLVMGGAHAAGTFDFAANDLSCDVLRYMFMLDTNFCAQTGISFFKQDAIRNGILAVFKFYSNAMLVFAAFILMYHLVSMIAETAHQGVVMGRRANQIWAPIRLIVAIGLLVPINGSLSTGQKIVIQIAAWGSGMGSQAWATFLGNSLEKTDVTIAGSPEVSGLVTGMVRNYACMYIHNSFLQMSDYNGKDAARIELVQVGTNPEEWSFENKIRNEKALCGSFKFVRGRGQGDVFYEKQKEIFKQQQSDWDSLGKEIARAFGASTSDQNIASLTRNFKGKIAEYIQKYEAAANFSKMNAGVEQAQSSATTAITQQAKNWGWMAAGAYPLAISVALQNIISNMSTSTPLVNSSVDFTLDALNNQERVDTVLAKLAYSMRDADLWIGSIGTKATASDTTPMLADQSSYAQSGASTHASFGPGNLSRNLFALAEFVMYKKGVWVADCASTAKKPCSVGQVNVDFLKYHPLIEFIGLGQRWLSGSLDLMGWGLALGAGGTILGSGLGDALKVLNARFSVIAGIIGPLAAVAAFAGPVIITFGFIGFAFSMMIAFYLPVIPFFKFFFNVLTWIIMVFEAVLAMPIFAIAHLTVEGDGLPGQLAKRAYFQIMGIFIRPLLLVAGLVMALVLFAMAAQLVDFLFSTAESAVNTGQAVGSNALEHIMFTVFYILMLYICAQSSFKAISFVADSALQWISASSWQEKMGDQGTMQGQLNQIIGYMAIQNAGQGFGQLNQQLSKIGTDKLAAQDANNKHRDLITAMTGRRPPP